MLTCAALVSSGPGVLVGTLKRNRPVILASGLVLGAMWLLGTRAARLDALTLEGGRLASVRRVGLQERVCAGVQLLAHNRTWRNERGGYRND